MVHKDDMVPDLLILPPGSDLHDHPPVANGSISSQRKASSMVEANIDPKPGWELRVTNCPPYLSHEWKRLGYCM
ncbi:putative 28S rRNA (cytosine-C(5))-methyltransferase [Cucumis melo var. makuwa]|uniref:28S rRNA (Cytosine-C(5))-methyltransferase n=1 Tax=Cucumis melo var. makuwa TaxID=1194695 RepID=A0A5A7UZD3_CUCMM|nr:putative 28S rRNA (cytosine-C(5))-methyltransferase [Cucumis melo var. makuwa]TYK14119.1 putative 28S rRNA (cytosine-C(5))-methyltransferase [Cucumis melo var. makuwa]